MTQEEKARRYDEVKNKLSRFIAQGVDPLITRADVQDFFPELAESKDEMIRKEILEYFQQFKNEGLRGINISDWIAWLEKQGEQNPYSGVSFKYNGNIWGMCARDNGVEILVDGEIKERVFLEKKELKKIEDKHTCPLDNSRSNVKFPFKAKVKSNGKIVTIYDGQLSADCKEWIKYQSDTEDGCRVYEPDDLELVYNIEQNPAYWTEYDEIMKNKLVDFMLSGIDISKAPHGCVAWIKSLIPQKQWKPSEEQMEALDDFIYAKYPNIEKHGAAVKSLYQDLKKLK